MRSHLLALCLLTCALPLAAADHAPACVPRGDGQDLACVSADMDDNLCVHESLNPPAPFTYQSSSTCVPLHCPPAICSGVPPIKVEGTVLP